MKRGKGWTCWVQHANTWQHWSLKTAQRKTAFVEQSWWPAFNMFDRKFDPWVYILFLDEGDFCRYGQEDLPAETGLCRPQARAKILPRPAQVGWTYCSNDCCMKGGEGWAYSSACQHVAILQFVSSAETDSAYSGRQTASFVSDRTDLSSFATHGDEYDWICIIVICVSLRLGKQCCAEKESLCGRVMMAWIWHVWINAMVFLPMAQAPHKADAKELIYSLPSKFDPWVYILFLDEGDFSRYA